MNTFYLSRLPEGLPGVERKNPERPFIISNNGSLSYAEFDSLVEKTAKWAASLGVKRDDHCAIIADNTGQYIILLFALWYNGAVPVPLNTRLLEGEINEHIERCKAEFVFTDNTFRQKNISGSILFPPEDYPESIIEPGMNDGDKTALILFTSGSSGSSKGVMLSFNNLLWSISGTDSLIVHTPEDRWLASLPFYHIGGLSIPLRAYASNCTVVIPGSLKSDCLLRAIKDYKPTLLSLVATSFRQLLQAGGRPWPELRYIFLGGGPIENALAAKSIADGWPVIKVYGSTETNSMVTAIEIKNYPDRISSAGKAIPGSTVCIRDDNGCLLPPGVSGEVVISGQTVMAGYFNDEQLTREILKGSDYYTGDLGHLDDEGFLYIEMRRTDLIISGGENINPMEVEGVISTYPGIKEVCVFPLRDEHWGQTAAAAIVSDGTLIKNEDEIALFIRSKLAPYKVPRKFFFTKELPKTPLGKIKREDVVNMFRG